MQCSHLPPADFARALELRLVCRLGASSQDLFHLMNASRANTIQFFQSELGKPIGYVTWARVGSDTLYQSAQTGQLPQFAHEWHEGELCLLVGVVFAPNWDRECATQLRQFVRSKRCVAYLRNRQLRVSVRRRGRHRARLIPH